MTRYKHTQVGYLMIVVTLAVALLFILAYSSARAEPPSYNSGSNFAMTAVMVLLVAVLTSFCSLHVRIDETYLGVKFGWGIYHKKFLLTEIASAQPVKNHWYYGWGIRVWFWPQMCIYNVSGLDAVEITLKNGNIYRIGTDEPQKLQEALLHAMTN